MAAAAMAELSRPSPKAHLSSRRRPFHCCGCCAASTHRRTTYPASAVQSCAAGEDVIALSARRIQAVSVSDVRWLSSLCYVTAHIRCGPSTVRRAPPAPAVPRWALLPVGPSPPPRASAPHSPFDLLRVFPFLLPLDLSPLSPAVSHASAFVRLSRCAPCLSLGRRCCPALPARPTRHSASPYSVTMAHPPRLRHRPAIPPPPPSLLPSPALPLLRRSPPSSPPLTATPSRAVI